jgi:hypothetical protein
MPLSTLLGNLNAICFYHKKYKPTKLAPKVVLFLGCLFPVSVCTCTCCSMYTVLKTAGQRRAIVNSIQFNSIKVNPSISKQSLIVTRHYKHAKEPTDILYQKHGYDIQRNTALYQKYIKTLYII